MLTGIATSKPGSADLVDLIGLQNNPIALRTSFAGGAPIIAPWTFVEVFKAFCGKAACKSSKIRKSVLDQYGDLQLIQGTTSLLSGLIRP